MNAYLQLELERSNVVCCFNVLWCHLESRKVTNDENFPRIRARMPRSTMNKIGYYSATLDNLRAGSPLRFIPLFHAARPRPK